MDIELFKQRGYRYGSPSESWKALREIKRAIEENRPVEPEQAAWFLTALNSMSKDDPKELTRALGFVENGRTRVVNKFDLVERMAQLVEKEGNSKIEAGRICAKEFGCHFETALHWYRKKGEVFKNQSVGDNK